MSEIYHLITGLGLSTKSLTICLTMVWLKTLKAHSQVWDDLVWSESPLKMMEDAFYFILKVLFFLKIFKLLFWLFAPVEKRLDFKDKVIFKLYDIRTWETNYCNIHITQCLKKQMQSHNAIGPVNRM